MPPKTRKGAKTQFDIDPCAGCSKSTTNGLECDKCSQWYCPNCINAFFSNTITTQLYDMLCRMETFPWICHNCSAVPLGTQLITAKVADRPSLLQMGVDPTSLSPTFAEGNQDFSLQTSVTSQHSLQPPAIPTTDSVGPSSSTTLSTDALLHQLLHHQTRMDQQQQQMAQRQQMLQALLNTMNLGMVPNPLQHEAAVPAGLMPQSSTPVVTGVVTGACVQMSDIPAPNVVSGSQSASTPPTTIPVTRFDTTVSGSTTTTSPIVASGQKTLEINPISTPLGQSGYGQFSYTPAGGFGQAPVAAASLSLAPDPLPMQFNVPLPTIRLTEFYGNFETFDAWWDSFDANVNSRAIPEKLKWDYLQQSVKGKAAKKIEDEGGGAPGKAKRHKNGAMPMDRDISPDRMSEDLSSEISHLSLDDDLESMLGTGNSNKEVEDNDEEQVTESAEEVITRKLAENLENATHKNPSIRLAALKILQGTLARLYIPEIVDGWKVTLADVVERSLKRSNTEEACVAGKCAALLAVQLGVEADETISKVVHLLSFYVADPTLAPQFRADCAVVLGVCLFLTAEELEETVRAVECVGGVWRGVKAGGIIPNEVVPLFCSSLQAWSMLLSQLPNRKVEEVLSNDLPKLCSYLECSQVEMRIATGETIAQLYELGSDLSDPEVFRPPNHHHTLEVLQALSNDSVKYRAKRDRRLQRCSFRQIFSAVKDGENPSIKVKFDSELMELESWTEKLTYDTLCVVLRGGMNFHLKQNVIFREIFQLGPPKLEKASRAQRKNDKHQQQAIQSSMKKARKITRGRQRDKRTAGFEQE